MAKRISYVGTWKTKEPRRFPAWKNVRIKEATGRYGKQKTLKWLFSTALYWNLMTTKDIKDLISQFKLRKK